jgi:hypothetical protein
MQIGRMAGSACCCLEAEGWGCLCPCLTAVVCAPGFPYLPTALHLQTTVAEVLAATMAVLTAAQLGSSAQLSVFTKNRLVPSFTHCPAPADHSC